MDSKRVTKPQDVRRRHAEAFKQALVQRSLSPGASVAAIAQEAGVNANLLFNWRRLHLQAQEQPSTEVPAPVLLPVTVVAAAPVAPAPPAPAPPPAPRPSSAATGTIEIDINGARIVSVRPTHLESPASAVKDRVHEGIGGHDDKREQEDAPAVRWAVQGDGAGRV